MRLPAPFSRYRSEVEEELKAIVGGSSSPLYTMLAYHLGWVDERGYPQDSAGGKSLRPTLCLLACEAGGGDWHSALPAAAAVELIHNFSLIHDDIEDGSRERRHRPTVWRVWGCAQGINAGDAMWALAQLALLRLEQRGIALEKIMRASRLLSETYLQICEGQYLDISYQSRPNIGVRDYLRMIEGKTAQLFGCSLALGAMLSTENKTLMSRLGSLGRNLGLAYQIQDDMLGIWGDERITGKPGGTDVSEKKKTLPIIYALRKAKGEDRERLRRIYSEEKVSAEDIAEVYRILDRVGARSYAEPFKQRYYSRVLRDLEKASLSPSVEAELKEVAAFVLG